MSHNPEAEAEAVSQQDVFDSLPDGEPVWAGEVADRLDANRRTIQRRLNELAALGRVERKAHGETKVVYWRP